MFIVESDPTLNKDYLILSYLNVDSLVLGWGWTSLGPTGIGTDTGIQVRGYRIVQNVFQIIIVYAYF